MLWISFAAAGYVLIRLWFYFFGFPFFKKLQERSSRWGEDPLKDRSACKCGLLLGDEACVRAAPLVFASRALLVRASPVC